MIDFQEEFHRESFCCPKHYVGSEVAVQKLHSANGTPGKPALSWEYISPSCRSQNAYDLGPLKGNRLL